MVPMNALATYLQERGKKAWLARQLGVTRDYVSKYCTGRLKITPEIAAAISAATSGEITVLDLLYPEGLPEGAELGSRVESPGLDG